MYTVFINVHKITSIVQKSMIFFLVKDIDKQFSKTPLSSVPFSRELRILKTKDQIVF